MRRLPLSQIISLPLSADSAEPRVWYVRKRAPFRAA